jgi:colicin import membrane protein
MRPDSGTTSPWATTSRPGTPSDEEELHRLADESSELNLSEPVQGSPPGTIPRPEQQSLKTRPRMWKEVQVKEPPKPTAEELERQRQQELERQRQAELERQRQEELEQERRRTWKAA